MFADVIINHAYARRQELFTYKIPEEMQITPGSGVVIPFNRKKQAGLVLNIHKERPEFKTLDIESVIEPGNLLKKWQLELAEWISEYYFCSKFDAIKLMLPKHIWRVPKKARKRQSKDSKWKPRKAHELTGEQAKIVDDILTKKPPISLIHGITGSGKTEIYKHLIQTKLAEGKQALLLAPEIALTPQLLKYFKGSFKNIAVIHSRVSDGQRAEDWKRIHKGEIQLVIGSRSALFSPFKDLGLIVMDEEHEWTYKQESSPRYHSTKVAKKIVQLNGAQLVLGSATPSMEQMWEASTGKIQLFTLSKRINGTQLPKVEIVDMREELKAKNFSIFSNKLEQKIRTKLANKEQVILFLNRRGSASSTVCRDCGEALSCKHCDTKLTYHARKMAHQTLICHHCGIIEKMPAHCPQCQSVRIKHFGVGTEKVETEVKRLFPNARVFRADRDTMTQKNSFKELHEALNKNEIDILIGTQMIAKGLDIPNVSLVGVLLADMGLHIPDFRSTERSFQLLTQVAGRAGRRETQGEVIIQSYSPQHPSIQHSKTHNYDDFYEQEISSRQSAHYPPFTKMIKLTFVHEDKHACHSKAEALKEKLSSAQHLVYAAPALIPRINNKYYWHILIQGEDPRSVIKKLSDQDLEGWRIDVDPIHTV